MRIARPLTLPNSVEDHDDYEMNMNRGMFRDKGPHSLLDNRYFVKWCWVTTQIKAVRTTGDNIHQYYILIANLPKGAS